MDPCLEFMDHLTFLFNAYSGKKSESDVIAECLIKYGFHFFVFIKYLSRIIEPILEDSSLLPFLNFV